MSYKDDVIYVTDYYRNVNGLPQYVVQHTRGWPNTK